MQLETLMQNVAYVATALFFPLGHESRRELYRREQVDLGRSGNTSASEEKINRVEISRVA